MAHDKPSPPVGPGTTSHYVKVGKGERKWPADVLAPIACRGRRRGSSKKSASGCERQRSLYKISLLSITTNTIQTGWQITRFELVRGLFDGMHADTDPPPPYEFEEPRAARVGQENNPISYHIYRSAGSYSIHLNDKEPLYVVETHTRNFSKPNLVVYARGRTSGKELANYRNKERAGLCDIGSWIDSNDKMSTVWWSNEIQDGLSAMHYRFTATLDFSSTIPGRAITNKRSRSFIWMNTPSLMLHEEETNTKMAIFHEHSDPTDLKCGILQVLMPFSDESNVTILTSFLAIYDRETRRFKRSIPKR